MINKETKKDNLSVDYLFVYGSLKSTHGGTMSKGLQKNAKYVGEATIKASLFKLSWFPGVILDTGYIVYGELYDISECPFIFAELDRYEGYNDNFKADSLFIRKVVNCTPFNRQDLVAKDIQAYVYEYNGKVKEEDLVESGNW